MENLPNMENFNQVTVTLYNVDNVDETLTQGIFSSGVAKSTTQKIVVRLLHKNCPFWYDANTNAPFRNFLRPSVII